ncbi:MAG: redox-sensing transcriptional repressor Rex [Cytophagales bacterium]|nr:redox-sensing transcriptional repressor Rex [Armatimonadota bacterium]
MSDSDTAPGTPAEKTNPALTAKVPVPTLERLTTYLRCLIDLGVSDVETVSSSQIEEHTGISAAQFRKDLSYFYPYFGEFGKPGVGYNVRELEAWIARILHIHKLQPILLIGAGNLGSALVGYPGLKEHKFQIVAAFDSDAAKVGKRLWGMDIVDFKRLGEVNQVVGARMAILAVPANAAQSAADAAVEHGIRAILNFAPVLLKVPRDVVVRNVSFLQELAVLSYHLTESGRSNGK